MRDFINAILAAIDTTSTTDEEWGWCLAAGVEVLPQSYTKELYNLMITEILDPRESVSTTRSRLAFYFEAKGISVVVVSAAKSNIYIGDAL